MRLQVRVWGPFWRLVLLALGFAFAGQPLGAQPLNLSSDPAAMGRLALGELKHGTAAVGVWRDGRATGALVQAGETDAGAQAEAGTPLLFEIGSISKVFAGLLLAQAVERGDLTLDDRLGDVLAGKVTFGSSAVASITLRQLVTHSSCLPRLPADFQAGSARENPYRSYERARMWAALAAQELVKAPPCEASYSNFGFGVLGEILSERYGKPWSELVRERITAPLGMHDTLQQLGDQAPRLAAGFVGREPTPPWDMLAFSGAGALRSTVPDMLLFSRAILAGRDGPLGPAAERMLTPLGRIDTGEIGYGVWIRGPAERRSYFHEGWTGGYRSVWMILPDTQAAFVLLTSNGQAQPWRARNALAASYYPVAAQASLIPATELGVFAGSYSAPGGGTATFVAQDGVLYGRPRGTAFLPSVPSGTDTFLNLDTGMSCRFARGPALPHAAPTSVTCSQGGGEQTLSRTASAPPLAVLPPAAVAAYAGQFVARRLLKADMVFDVRASAGQLAVKLDNQLRYPVFPVPGQPDRFAYDVVKAELQFERDTSGKVVAMVLHQNGEFRALRSGN